MHEKAARKRVSPVICAEGLRDDRPEAERRAHPLDAPIPYTLGELAAYVEHRPQRPRKAVA